MTFRICIWDSYAIEGRFHGRENKNPRKWLLFHLFGSFRVFSLCAAQDRKKTTSKYLAIESHAFIFNKTYHFKYFPYGNVGGSMGTLSFPHSAPRRCFCWEREREKKFENLIPTEMFSTYSEEFIDSELWNCVVSLSNENAFTYLYGWNNFKQLVSFSYLTHSPRMTLLSLAISLLIICGREEKNPSDLHNIHTCRRIHTLSLTLSRSVRPKFRWITSFTCSSARTFCSAATVN